MLRPWGWARERRIRHGTGMGQDLQNHRPRRGRCAGCSGTHVLLGVELAARRADEAAVIAAAVEAKTAAGHGHRRIAARLGRPASTVRGWLRSFAASAGPILRAFTALAHRDGADPAGLWPAPARTPAGAALAAVTAYASVLADRFAVAALPWQSTGLAASGPFFFSTGRWQHELALTPAAGDGKGEGSSG
ncbi:hypothetical protein [Pseudarthrobacter sp. S9]|uniref:hypothetical protein n=1 Tax=Pseudarthrobacter sp. S9 TaxID=3418421 RepID=UPI003D00B149